MAVLTMVSRIGWLSSWRNSAVRISVIFREVGSNTVELGVSHVALVRED